ncbi:hypothetical protein I4U23_024719 [Adineta vaga]|nr:hypothetical protein I4U23_024719 [Adineta vaga]
MSMSNNQEIRLCVICNAKSIGINFGVLTCAPCKAFFRRNARRKEIFETSCLHGVDDCSTKNENISYCAIRRCSSCRLRRCFTMGMKEELVRTNEENIRHKQLVDNNRRRRQLFRKKQQQKQLSIPQFITNKNVLISESDWCHISNIISAYETYCLTTYLHQRSIMPMNDTFLENKNLSLRPSTVLPMSITMALFAFLHALPATRSLSHMNQTYLCKNNLRSLLFPNTFELNQLCFKEPWQTSFDASTWRFICGDELYEQFVYIENLAEQKLITDPVITRLWMVVLYFSSSLFCLYDVRPTFKIPKKKTAIRVIQDAYVILLWNYLLHRYGDLNAVQIYSNLILVYLKMQRVGFDIGLRVRTRHELTDTHKVLNQLLTLDIKDS